MKVNDEFDSAKNQLNSAKQKAQRKVGLFAVWGYDDDLLSHRRTTLLLARSRFT